MARTAVVAGTATAVSNRVSRRQAGRWAEQDRRQYEQYQQYQEPAPQYVPQQYEPAPAAAAGSDSMIDQLKQLAELKEAGVLTEAEFAAQKAKILGT